MAWHRAGRKPLCRLSGKVIRFDPRAADPATQVRDVVTGLPDSGRHPCRPWCRRRRFPVHQRRLATDHCERADGSAPDPAAPCPETVATPPRGSILHLTPT